MNHLILFQCCVPSPEQLLKDTCRPCQWRWHCTIIPEVKLTTHLSASWALCLEHLGGLIPILRWRPIDCDVMWLCLASANVSGVVKWTNFDRNSSLEPIRIPVRYSRVPARANLNQLKKGNNHTRIRFQMRPMKQIVRIGCPPSLLPQNPRLVTSVVTVVNLRRRNLIPDLVSVSDWAKWLWSYCNTSYWWSSRYL